MFKKINHRGTQLDFYWLIKCQVVYMTMMKKELREEKIMIDN